MGDEAAKLGGPDEVLIFFREGGWYPIQGVVGRAMTLQAMEHAERNPGTLRVEDINGTVLWRLQ